MLWRTVVQFVSMTFRQPLGLYDLATCRFRCLPTDIDILFHMNNGVYLSIMDIARIDLLRRSGAWRAFRRRGWYPVVLAATITFRKSIKLGQAFTIQTKVLGFDDQAVFLEQRFIRRGETCARATIRARFLKRGGGTVNPADLQAAAPTPLPPGLTLPPRLAEWAQHTALPSTRAPAPSMW